MGKNGMKLWENYQVMGNVQQITRYEVFVNQYGLIDTTQPLFRMATVNE